MYVHENKNFVVVAAAENLSNYCIIVGSFLSKHSQWLTQFIKFTSILQKHEKRCHVGICKPKSLVMKRWKMCSFLQNMLIYKQEVHRNSISFSPSQMYIFFYIWSRSYNVVLPKFIFFYFFSALFVSVTKVFDMCY